MIDSLSDSSSAIEVNSVILLCDVSLFESLARTLNSGPTFYSVSISDNFILGFRTFDYKVLNFE